LPGATKTTHSFNYDVIEFLRKSALNPLPIVGACAADDCKWQETYQFCNGQVYTNAFVAAFVETHLKFGIATTHDFEPSGKQALITAVDGYVIKELYHRPAAEYFAGMTGVSLENLKEEPQKYFLENPFGIRDAFGNYFLLIGADITPEGGIKCLRKPFPHSNLYIMETKQDKLFNSAAVNMAKALRRDKITRPAAGIMFSSVHRIKILGEQVHPVLENLRRVLKNSNLAGCCSYGEQGVSNEGVSVHFNLAVTGLIVGDELNEASAMAFKNKELYEELCATAARNQELYSELEAVHQLGNLLNSSLKLDFIIPKAVQMVGEMFRADGCGLFLYDEATNDFFVSGLYGHQIIPRGIKIENTLPFYAIKEGRKLLINNIRNNPYVSRELNKVTRAKSLMAVPIIIKDKRIGAISVYSKIKNFYNEKDLEFLDTLANQIGISVMNADLFERTELLACTDGLTGVYDHNYFLKALDRYIEKARKRNQNFSLVMIDLDDFKFYNDKFGHVLGDEILKNTAGILIDSVRNDDIISRYGGDEFAVILNGAKKDRAYQIAERIRKRISQMVYQDPESKHSFSITASIGISTFPDDAVGAKQLVDKADKAMYRVKRNVKNKTEHYLSEFSNLEKEFTASEKAFFDTIKLLINLLDARDRYTWEHCRQVASFAVEIAKEMKLPERDQEYIRLTGYLHDIGKIHVQPDVLNKPTSLSDDETSVVRLHPIVGANLLAPIRGFKKIIPLIYHHHEWYNGGGYPDGLAGENIPLAARVLAVADGFDAMTSNRPYRKAQTVAWAIEEIKKQRGVQYDPAVVDAFIRVWSDRCGEKKDADSNKSRGGGKKVRAAGKKFKCR
jgi:diguanylate cyclase (GGDEF)-like protein/putative nucleotidyltransferase with HDIG domain